MYNVPNLQLTWLLTLGAYQTRTHGHRQDLSSLVGVPVSACPWGEHYLHWMSVA
jgi:hypothetical protein